MPARVLPFPSDHPYGQGPGELRGEMPLGSKGLAAGGKSLADWLGEVLTAPAAGKSFPARMRLTSLDPEKGQALLHDLKSFTPFEATIKQLRQLLSSGQLQQAGGAAPESASVPQLIKRLAKVARRTP